VTGHLWYLQRQEAAKQVPRIATTDPLGAARILYAFAEAYAGYLPTFDATGAQASYLRIRDLPMPTGAAPGVVGGGVIWVHWPH
jgi:hypothetical protein